MSIFGAKKFNNSSIIKRSLGGTLLPQDCALCAVEVGDAMLCVACFAALPHHDFPACPQCALPVVEGSRCARCLTNPPAFDRTRAAFEYRYPVAQLLHAFKYGNNLALGKFFAEALFHTLSEESWPELIVPMPLHCARLKERGFNQAAEIARRLALATGTPLLLDDLRKIRDTKPQASLPWKERQANVKGAFACAINLHGQRVAVVDDVMTTGATLNEVAKTLKKRGAAQVDVWVAVRTLPDAAITS